MSDPLNDSYLYNPKGQKKEQKEIIANEPAVKKPEQLPETLADRVDTLIRNPLENTTHFPQGINLEDLDSALQHKIKDEWIVTINDEQVPIIDISLTLFNEFNRTGQFSDDKKNIFCNHYFTKVFRFPAKVKIITNWTRVFAAFSFCTGEYFIG